MNTPAIVTPAREQVDAGRTPRITLPGARNDRLYFAQVREDPCLEIDALRPNARSSLVVVSSGGCTALSLLAAGAGRVAAVDLNRSQNHLVELKIAAVAALPRSGALAFLGATPIAADACLAAYERLRRDLTPDARGYWDARRARIAEGVLNAGASERFIRLIVRALETFVHPRSRIRRLLACEGLEEQQAFFAREWDTWRWRAFFRVFLNRVAFDRAYHPAFFRHVANPGFADHFRLRAERALTRVPVADNYFLHHMFTGVYPVNVPGGVPPYLSDAGARAVGARRGALTLVDSAVTDYLRTLPDRCVTGFALSNICEWSTAEGIDELFAQVARTAVPGARLCFRNFVGWTDVPRRWRRRFVEHRAHGRRSIAHDRSAVQRRFTVCVVHPEGPR